MHMSKRIVLPLALGLANVAKEPAERLSTANLEIQLELKCKLVKGLYCGNEIRMGMKEVRYQGERMMVSCGEGNGKTESEKLVNVMQQQAPHISLAPFQVNFTRNGEDLSLNINKQLLNFTMYSVPKSRFVKNQKLEQVINQKKQQCGPLSMDKSQRILLEPQNTTFPIIGLWISSNEPLSNSRHLSRLVSHIFSKGSKIFFTFQGRTFFYLVTLSFLKNVPELYLVQWKADGKSEKTLKLCKKDAFTKAEITMSSDQQSNLEFTLRSDEKVPETLLNIACSPIKFPSCSDDTKNSTPDSPRFKLDRSDMAEQECASLKRLVKSQEIEINDLRAEILRLSGELRQCKRHRHYCESQEMSTSYISSFRQNQKIRRLTRSDLNFDSPSPCNEQRQQANPKAELQQNVWDRFQLVDK